MISFLLITFLSVFIDVSAEPFLKSAYIVGLIMIVYGFFILLSISKLQFYISNQTTIGIFFEDEIQIYKMEDKKKLLNVLIKRHIILLALFFICYLPNNLLHLLYLFSNSEIFPIILSKISICLLSSSCMISFAVKTTEIGKHLKWLILKAGNNRNCKNSTENTLNIIDTITKDSITRSENINSITKDNHDTRNSTSVWDYSNKIFSKEKMIEMKLIDKDYSEAYEYLSQSLKTVNHFARLVGICACLDQEYNSTQFSDNVYTESEKSKIVSDINIPDYYSHLAKRIRNFTVEVSNHSPKIFYDIRKHDNVTNGNIIESLAPDSNVNNIKKNLASGGRSSSTIVYSHDRKFVIKIITQEEKCVLFNMLKEYHRNIVSNQTLLARIYGCYTMTVNNNRIEYIILMKNMCELPLNTRILSFDLKGSSVDRNVLSRKDIKQIKNQIKFHSYFSTLILKDGDLRDLGLKLKILKKDADELEKIIKLDTDILKRHFITDYSLLVFVHSFPREDYDNLNTKESTGKRIIKSSDNKFLYCISIIDFLTIYDLSKMGEILYKNVKGYFKQQKDLNISAMEHVGYASRFNKFIRSCIEEI